MARQPKPWYRADRQVWCVTVNGQRHSLGPNKKQAFEQFYALMREPRREKVIAQELVEIVDHFLDWVDRNRSRATFEWYRCRLQSFIDHYPTLSLAELKPHHVERWAGSAKVLASATRRNQMRAIKRCLKWAVVQGYLDTNPIAHLEVPGAQPRNVYVSPAEFEKLLAFVPDDAFRDLLVVTYATGCRPQESLRVEARHVDLANARWVFPAQEAKVKSQPRIVYLPPEALRVTERLMKLHPHGPLFRNKAGRPWVKDAVGCAFDRLAIRMGRAELKARGEVVPESEIEAFIKKLRPQCSFRGQTVSKSKADLRFEAKRKLTDRLARDTASRYSLYALRHSWATNALQRGVDALTVAVLMGHRDPSTLARTYQHLSHNPQHLLSQAQKAAS